MDKVLCEEKKILGVHTFRVYSTESAEARALEKAIERHVSEYSLCTTDYQRAEHRKRYKELTASLEPYLVEEVTLKNLIPTIGRSVLMQRLAGTTTYTGVINYGALGSGSTAPANADTELDIEVFRKPVASASFTDNIAFIDFFFTQGDTNGTYNEWGTFIDGTGSANSGQMFSHMLTGGWTKSSSNTMTIACTYTLT